ncbi:hypothetical protein U8Q06_20905 [Rhizobium beringeri]|uniref:hypothetical protein n=1 Tax=Rhizobium beringeri TaxID=3019934 RepID=UPI002E12C53D|nr:hypothetical protein U8Q06_20905 [Rhizobium beringeri]
MQKTVELTRSYEAHGKTFNVVTLREPTYATTHVEGIGRPYEYQPTKGGVIAVTYPTVVDEYLQRLVVEPGYECIGQISAVDALRLERAVCDFFTEVRLPQTPPTGSSSDTASAPTASSE